jgi:hypothetical protein
MGVSVKDKLSAVKQRQSPASKVAAKLNASKKLLDDEAIAKARALLKGDKGDKGDPGPQGPKGDKGDKGDPGHTPIAGIDFIIHHGKDGEDGRQGRDGDTGLTDDTVLQDATFTYTGDLVTRIDYADGQSKVLTYNADDSINTIVWDRISHIVTKTFTYDAFSKVLSVDVSGAIDIDDDDIITGLVPYVGAVNDVDLGLRSLSAAGIRAEEVPTVMPTGPGVDMWYIPDFIDDDIGLGVLACMDWDTGPQPIGVFGSEVIISAMDVDPDSSFVGVSGYEVDVDAGVIELYADDTIELSADTIELSGGIINNVVCDDCNVTINSEDTNNGRFIVTGDNRTGFISKSTNTGSNSQFGLGVNVGGGLVTVAVNTAGADYQIGDVLYVLQPGAGADGGYVSVVDVDAGGGVTDIMIPFGCTGTAYIVGNALETSGGYGTGCLINITAVTAGSYVFLQSSHIGTGSTRPIQLWTDNTSKFSVAVDGTINITNVSEHDDNAAALLAGHVVGDVYRTGDLLKIVH